MADSGKPKCGTCGEKAVEATPVVPDEPACTPAQEEPVLPDPTPCVPSSPVFCPEDHTETIIKKSFTYVLKTKTAFNFPAIGQYAEFTVEGVDALLPGSVLWNKSIGNLYVDKFYRDTQKVRVVQQGDDCNVKDAGDVVPACTQFVVGPQVCGVNAASTSTTTRPFLSADFTAPGDGSCSLAKVTTIEGLEEDELVTLNGYKYRLTEILDTTTIQLCDEGDGAPAGQVTQADSNCDGVPDVPLLIVATPNPCSREETTGGVVLVCDEGTSRPLPGTEPDQILVWDNDAKKWFPRTVVLPTEICTTLTACFTWDPFTGSPILITVVSTAAFEEGEVIRINGELFIVESINSETQMRVEATDGSPSDIIIFPVGALVCEVGCCDKLCSSIELNCCPQVITGSIELANVSLPISIASGEFSGVLKDAIVQVVAPEGDCNWFCELDLQILAMVDHNIGIDGDGTPLRLINEIEFVQDTLPSPRVIGKVSWTDVGSDGYDIEAAYPAAPTGAIWTQVQGPAPRYAANWYAGMVRTYVDLAGGASATFDVLYRCALPNNFGGSAGNVHAIYASLGGWVKFFRKDV